MTIQADTSTFDEHIQNPCIVDFFMSDCPSCEKFGPVFEQTALKHTGYRFLKVNLDDDITLAERYGVTHIPTAMKFIHGKPVASATGYMDVEAFTQFIEGEEVMEDERISAE